MALLLELPTLLSAVGIIYDDFDTGTSMTAYAAMHNSAKMGGIHDAQSLQEGVSIEIEWKGATVKAYAGGIKSDSGINACADSSGHI